MTHSKPILRSAMTLVLFSLPLVACLGGRAGEPFGDPAESNTAALPGEGGCLLTNGVAQPQRCHQTEDPNWPGVQHCVLDPGEAVAGAFTGGHMSACKPDRSAIGKAQCEANANDGGIGGYHIWAGECCANEYGCCPGEECNTPLVLSFGGEAVRYSAASAHVTFDLSGHQQSQRFDWPTAATPWLAMDRDGNGRIDDGGELFGSATMLSSGALATNGFAALSDLDDNRDGAVDARDAVWSRLSVWRDDNGDRVSQPAELVPMAAEGLVRIDLAYRIAPRCDARHNCELERATFAFRDPSGAVRTGAVIDVHLKVQ
jgi:hypothetical protein